MSRDQFTRWTCNSCGSKEETKGGDQPKSWVGYGFTAPNVPAGERTVLGHLCPDCTSRLNVALRSES